jgi:hypothetical protein
VNFLVQNQEKQILVTTLAEYKEKNERALPSLAITYYKNLMTTKGNK